MVQALDEVRRSRAAGARVPPHDLAAEASLLGAMLLSPNAIGAAAEVRLKAEDFYKPAHGHIYEAIESLYQRGDPADPITVADELRRDGLLEAVGGPPTLIQLQTGTPAISNAGRYARIVEEHALLRRLIGVASEVAELGYSMPDDVAAAVDRAETLVFDVNQRRISDDLMPVRDLLTAALDKLEQLYERGEAVTGVPTGFTDLDHRLAGLQPNNLVVIGARPGMGKTSLALGMLAHAAMDANVPSLLFSLEMGRDEITQRLLCSEARVDASKLRTGNFDDRDWGKVSAAVGRLAEAPIFIDDNPNVTVMDIRAKARRLKAREGLGLIIIDYLQLMSGRQRAESRQVEVSEMSRSLKILARELQTPVVALSQLSRGLESRQDKRPLLSDLRESGCVTADTRVLRADTGAEVAIGELLRTGETNIPVWSLDEELKLVPATMTHVFPSGVKEVFELRLASGRTITASSNHPFRTLGGWTRLDELAPGTRVAVPREVPESLRPIDWPEAEVIMLAHLLGDGCVASRQPVHYTSQAHVYLPSPVHLTHGVRNPIQEWLARFGLDGLRSHQKFVPTELFSLTNGQVALFLRHLWATDGCVHVPRDKRNMRVYYASSSRRLADDVQSLLLRFEVRTRVRAVPSTRGRTQYHVVISGRDDQLRFLEHVGVHGERGVAACEMAEILRERASNTNRDTVPREVWSVVRQRMTELGITTRKFAAGIGSTYGGTSHFKFAPSRRHLGKVALLLDDASLTALSESSVYWDTVEAITPKGEEPVYDATVAGTHNFVANGILIHNSIEQDADVVLFIYRDEIYNPESQDKGVAEIIVAKHRNGPTGTTQLAFLDHYTRFANMARG